ncbi:3397_t:CDS:1, partial [Paraglomus brasilianum]
MSHQLHHRKLPPRKAVFQPRTMCGILASTRIMQPEHTRIRSLNPSLSR